MQRTVILSFLLTASLYPQARKFTLPPPNPAGQVANAAKLIPQPADKKLTVPAGFTAEEYAGGFQKPRDLLQLPGGAILVTESVPKGGVYVVNNDNDKDRKPLISGLDRPFGMAFHDGYLYVAEAESIKRFKLDPRALTPGPAEPIVDLKGYGKGHWTRSLAIDAKAKKLYVSVGSGSNVDLGDPPNRNAVNVYNLDGTSAEIFATGLRNPVAIRFQPESKKLWATVQERDGLGDELAPDFFTEVKKGAFYGWPFAYIGPNEEPRHKGVNPEAVKKTIEPDILLGAHVSAMSFEFYTGKMFPAKYRNGAFIALRGSSGRSKRVGYSMVFQNFKSGKPVGQPEPFLTGFMLGEDVKEVWGRPVGVAQLADGSLLLSEDGNNKIWRIAYNSGSLSR
ncbi:MAG: PQQ-dependent sugar dehydrogenase [Bryobacteraceae bacterium]